MANQYRNSLKKFNKSLAKDVERIHGELGIQIGGEKVVEIPNRNSFVYVRIGGNLSEIVECFNDKVSPAYNLPVLIVRDGNRYKILGRDTERYSDWENFSSYLPRHGNTHAFSVANSGAGDIVWVEGQQFMPALIFPSGSSGAGNVLISPYSLRSLNGTWKYIGDTGTSILTGYNPISGSVLVLISLDSESGNPYLQATTGSYISESYTGTAQLLPYLPFNTNPRYVPDSFVRLVSGTSAIGWEQIYDIRQFISPIPTGSSGGNGQISVQDSGVTKGNASVLNFTGDVVDVSVSGTVANIFITGTTPRISEFYGDQRLNTSSGGYFSADTNYLDGIGLYPDITGAFLIPRSGIYCLDLQTELISYARINTGTVASVFKDGGGTFTLYVNGVEKIYQEFPLRGYEDQISSTRASFRVSYSHYYNAGDVLTMLFGVNYVSVSGSSMWYWNEQDNWTQNVFALSTNLEVVEF